MADDVRGFNHLDSVLLSVGQQMRQQAIQQMMAQARDRASEGVYYKDTHPTAKPSVARPDHYATTQVLKAAKDAEVQHQQAVRSIAAKLAASPKYMTQPEKAMTDAETIYQNDPNNAGAIKSEMALGAAAKGVWAKMTPGVKTPAPGGLADPSSLMKAPPANPNTIDFSNSGESNESVP